VSLSDSPVQLTASSITVPQQVLATSDASSHQLLGTPHSYLMDPRKSMRIQLYSSTVPEVPCR
jgi:hypothetical protein